MDKVIDQFRVLNGKGYVDWDDPMCGYCLSHSWAMANRGKVYNAQASFLNGWLEAVAMDVFKGGESRKEVETRIVFEVLGTKNRDILLESCRLACGSVRIEDKIWVTVRGQGG